MRDFNMTLQNLEHRLRDPTPQEKREDLKIRQWLLQVVNRPLQMTDLMRKCRVDFTVVRRALGDHCDHPDCQKSFPEWLLPSGEAVCLEHKVNHSGDISTFR